MPFPIYFTYNVTGGVGRVRLAGCSSGGDCVNGLEIGDIVARKSYGCDVCFKVVDIDDKDAKKIATLKGIIYRLEADAPASDLEIQCKSSEISKNT